MLMYLLVTVSILSSANTYTLSETERLHGDLAPAFETAHMRPALNLSDSVQVKVEIYLIGIYSFDVKTQVVSSKLHWKVSWINLMFQWVPSSYGGIESIRVPLQNIWTPDLIISNSRGRSELGTDSRNTNIEIFSNGKIIWWPARDTETSCSFDITNYPFDIQTCHIIVDKWHLNDSKQSFESLGNAINTDWYEKNGEWELSGTNVTKSVLLFEGQLFTKVYYTIQLSRRWQRKCLSIILPVIILSFTNCFCFCLPVASGEKTGLAIAIFLTFIFLLSGLSNSIPPSSVTMSVFEVYINVQLMLSGLTVVLTVMIMSVYYTDTTLHIVWWKSFLRQMFYRNSLKTIPVDTSDSNANQQRHDINDIQRNRRLINEDGPRLYSNGTRERDEKAEARETGISQAGYENHARASKSAKKFSVHMQSKGTIRHPQDETDMSNDRNMWQKTAENMDNTLFVVFFVFNAIEVVLLFALLLRRW